MPCLRLSTHRKRRKGGCETQCFLLSRELSPGFTANMTVETSRNGLTAFAVVIAVLTTWSGGVRARSITLHLHVVREEPIVTDAVCVLTDSINENVTGVFGLRQEDPDGMVAIKGDVYGLSPGRHGFHIHSLGDLSHGCLSTGNHFDVGTGSQHGGRQDVWRHVGDLGNVEADTLGDALFEVVDNVISLNGPNSVVGRALIIHQQEDDLGTGNNPESKRTGNSGPVVACGVIGIARDAGDS